MWDINVFIMQIEYVKIYCKEDVLICRTNFAKKMERNSHERTSRWKMYGKQLFFEDLEVRDGSLVIGVGCFDFYVLGMAFYSIEGVYVL
jgi:hypothetical protein